MDKIKLSLDRESFWEKPQKDDIPKINSRIGKSIKALTPSAEDIREFAENVGVGGHTFCPASFKDGCRKKDNFEQQQFFALDFDNKGDRKVTFEEVQKRAKQYDLPILFAYDTFSSTEHDKFRVVFLNDASISNRKVVKAMQLGMGKMFPEADSSCYKDESKMYFGGKELIYYDNKIPTTNVESIFRSLSYYFKKTYHDKHYKEKIKIFSKKTGISLNKNGLLDVTVVDNLTEEGTGTTNNKNNENGGNAPSPIIVYPNIIVGNGAIPPNSYKINLINECTSNGSVANNSNVNNSVTKSSVSNNSRKHSLYRSSTIRNIRQKCRLFCEFENGERKLHHNELFGILNNLINVDTGGKLFIDGISKDPYDDDRIDRWEYYCTYNKQHEYSPSFCDN